MCGGGDELRQQKKNKDTKHSKTKQNQQPQTKHNGEENNKEQERLAGMTSQCKQNIYIRKTARFCKKKS